MNKQQIETIKVYKEAIKHVESMQAETTDEKLARDYATYYYAEKETHQRLIYHMSEEYEKEMKEEDEFFGSFDETGIENDIRWQVKEDEAAYRKCRAIKEYLQEIADEKLIEKYMKKYGWI